MRKFIIFLACLYVAKLPGQTEINPTGNLFNPVEYANLLANPWKRKDLRKIAKNLPPSYSLRKYCPTPGNQSPYGTCTAWALAAARTILLTTNKNITDQEIINALWFSPGFIYENIKNTSDEYCKDGSAIEQGLKLLKQQGVCFDHTLSEDCNVYIPEAMVKEALQYTIEDYRRIFFMERKDETIKVKEIKYQLNENHPVIISFRVPSSFHNSTGKFWVPLPMENFYNAGNHAMVIVGYDDDYKVPGKPKGAFLFMNSWGEDWKDEGFVWVSYKDFINWCRGAYYAIPWEEELMPEFKGKLHLFVIADTGNPKNGENASKNASAFLHAFHQIGHSALLQPIDYWLVGTKYNRREVLDAISEADIGIDDAVVLYYYGQGFNQNGNEFPNLQFDGKGSLLLTGLEKKITEKTPRLSLLIADCNNTEADYSKPRRKLASYLLPRIDDMSLKRELIHEEYFSAMFRKFQGQILVAAGKKGQKAIYDSKGSFFLRGMLYSFLQLDQSTPDWNAELSLASVNTQNLAQAFGYVQQPIYRISISSIQGNGDQTCDVTSLMSELLQSFKQTWRFEEKKKLAFGVETICTPDAEVVILIDGVIAERMPAVQYLKELVVNPRLDSLQVENMSFEGCLLKELFITEFYSGNDLDMEESSDAQVLTRRLIQRTDFLWHGISRLVSDASITDEERMWIENVMIGLFAHPESDTVEVSFLDPSFPKQVVKVFSGENYIKERIGKYYQARYDKLAISISTPIVPEVEGNPNRTIVDQEFVAKGKKSILDYEDRTFKEITFKFEGDAENGRRIKINRVKVLGTQPRNIRP